MNERLSAESDAWRKRLGAALVARGDVYAVVADLLAEARNEALIEAADAVEDECSHSSNPCFCGSADWLRTRVTPPTKPAPAAPESQPGEA